jgi:DNA-binding NtrC family response regulator
VLQKGTAELILRVIVAAQERTVRNRIARLLASDDVLLTPAQSLRRVMMAPETQTCDVIVAAATAADPDPTEVLDVTATLPGRPDVICLRGGDDRGGDARLLAAGAIAVVPITLPDQELAPVLQALLQRRRTIQPVDPGDPSGPEHTPPRSVAMQELLRLADRVAVADSSVLILGETGTGKEWLARRLHDRSPRSAGPFVPVNCAAIPEGLIESELFGHVRGAFTGAVRSKRGQFEVADGGTLFLDEIADVSPSIQAKLLRALQDHEFHPIGSERSLRVDVRVVAATNRDLDDAVRQATFRQDLYYRLAVITLHLPPLRERREDIPDLVDAYVRHYASLLGRPVAGISERAVEALVHYSWPGNIRELINVIERAVLLAAGSTLDLGDLPTGLWASPVSDRSGPYRGHGDGAAPPTASYAEARNEALAAFELRYLSGLLESTRGRVGEAAKQAGMSPRSLYGKMKALGLRKEDFKG